eukprot:8239888-Pyramimonas_sp.AAC.1
MGSLQPHVSINTGIMWLHAKIVDPPACCPRMVGAQGPLCRDGTNSSLLLPLSLVATTYWRLLINVGIL